MIRQSATIATIALVLSLLTHIFGLGLTLRAPTEDPDRRTSADSVELGQAFEDVAEPSPAPATPEPTPAPPVEESPAPEPPITRALVASDNPVNTRTPDLGTATNAQPDAAEPPEPTITDAPEPEALEPPESAARASPEAAVSQPAGSSVASEPAETPAGAPAEPRAVAAIATATIPSIAPVPTPETQQEPTPVPGEVTAALPVAPVSVPSVVAVEPSFDETVAPNLADTPTEPVPETPAAAATDGEPGGSELALRSSVRPKARAPVPEAQSTPEGENGSEPRVVLDSALTLLRREGALSGGSSQNGSRAPGNASVTNYAGRVLVHLNSIPKIKNRARGTAVVSFEINSDGSLAWVTVSRSTGTHEFDSEARAQVRRAAPFPRPPKGANRRITFSYRAD